jgi:hypothetical protein
MLAIDIKWLIPAALLSSDRVLEYSLNRNLTATSITDVSSLKQHAFMCIQDFQSYLCTPLRQEDTEFALKSWLNERFEISISSVIQRVHKHFLDWRGDRFEVKAERLEEWLALIAMLDPTWVIGYGYADLLQHKVLGIEQVLAAAEHQCPSALPKRFDGRPVADNHVHLNGHGHNSLSLLDFSLYLTDKPNLAQSQWPYRPECSLFNSGKLDITQLPLMVNQLFSRIVEEIWLPDESIAVPNWEQLALCDLNTNLLAMFENQQAETMPQRLLAYSHLQDTSETGRWLLLVTGLLLENELNSDEVLTQKITSYVQASNLLRNYMIVSGVGLGNFVDYFGFKHRKPQSNNMSGLNYKNHSLAHDFSSHTHREFRGAPGLIINDKENRAKTKISYKLKPTELTRFANELIAKNLDSRSHFVIHFNRGFSKYSHKGDKLQYVYRNQLLTQVRKLQEFFCSAHYSDLTTNTNLASTSFPQSGVDLRALVRGFDVAGNENELPIEIFAPTLRVLRSAKHEHQSRFEKRLRQPFLTIHAGEDYSHLLSGLRAIDEAVVFCDFKPGDRLGHALALGVDAYDWAKRQQRIYLTAGQHLDNLVWCYFQALELIQQLPEFQAVLSVIENKIQRWSSHVYGDRIIANDLYQAWKLRRNCPLMQPLPSQAVGTEWEIWVPDMIYLEKNKNSKPVELWQHYLNQGVIASSNTPHRCDDVVSIDCRNLNYHANDDGELSDNLSNSELRLIHAIQDLLIERYSKRQIVLEACPTSNIFIGRFKQYVEHPIFRWNSPCSSWLANEGKFNKFGIRKGPITVCVNTDDAGLMPTTIENEHRILKETAIKEHGVGAFAADQWIDTIRQTGVDIFKSNHLDWVHSSSQTVGQGVLV